LRNKSTVRKDPASVTAGPANTPTPSQLENANIVQTPTESADAKTPPKKDLLSEPMAANKEQRKADWAIMKEMAKYLWPKVIPECYCYRVSGY
jgi:ABC transporter ATM